MTNIQLDPKKLTDPELRVRWQGFLTRGEMALTKVKRMASAPYENPDRPDFVEAVNEYHRAREDERAFFYQNFYKQQ